MNKRMKLILIPAAMILTLAACDPYRSDPPPPPSTTIAPGTITTENHPDGKCHEDDPCWDCATMGNRICGPAPAIGDPLTIEKGVDGDLYCWYEATDDHDEELICGTLAQEEDAMLQDFYRGSP